MSGGVKLTSNMWSAGWFGKFSATSDWFGMVASIGCAIHCAAMPFVIASLPAMGLSFLADEAFHKWMAVICFAIAIAAFVPGWRKHRRLMPLAVGGIGLALISVAAFGLAGECCAGCDATSAISAGNTDHAGAVCTAACCENAASQPSDDKPLAFSANLAGSSQVPPSHFLSGIAPWLTPIGGLLLVTAHLLNRRFGCLCGCCP